MIFNISLFASSTANGRSFQLYCREAEICVQLGGPFHNSLHILRHRIPVYRIVQCLRDRFFSPSLDFSFANFVPFADIDINNRAMDSGQLLDPDDWCQPPLALEVCIL